LSVTNAPVSFRQRPRRMQYVLEVLINVAETCLNLKINLAFKFILRPSLVFTTFTTFVVFDGLVNRVGPRIRRVDLWVACFNEKISTEVRIFGGILFKRNGRNVNVTRTY
jgi:hypothetical protein